MNPPRALNAKKKLEKRARTKAVFPPDFDLSRIDPAKLRVMAYFGSLVVDGFAEWKRLENGAIQLRLRTSEMYLLEETSVTRIV